MRSLLVSVPRSAILVGICTALALAATLLAPGGPAAPGTEVSAAAAAPATVTATDDRSAKRPNIVVVMADDMRADEVRFAPRLKHHLERHGLRFENSFANYPLCCPNRATFLLGKYAHNHKVWYHKKPYGFGALDDSTSIATSLKRAGYRTGFIGKYLNGYGKQRSRVTGRSSHTYVPAGWDDWRGLLDGAPRHVRLRGSTYNYFNQPFNVNGRIVNNLRGRYSSRVIGDFGVDMIQRFSARAKPFFLYVNFVAPHHGRPVERDDPGRIADATGRIHDFVTPARPGWVKGRFDRLIDRSIGLAQNGASEADVSDKPKWLRRPALLPREKRALREVTRQRAESIYVMDQNIERMIQALKRSGEWRNTVFAFTSDNGYYMGEHRKRSGKVTGHEPSFRVPLLLTGPGMRSGTKRYDPISTVDLTATIVDIADARPPREPDGVSRYDAMLRGDRGWRTPVIYEAINTAPRSSAIKPGFKRPLASFGIRTVRFSYIRHRSGHDELYDLRVDPHQLQNVARDPAYATVRRALDGVWWQVLGCRGAACRVTLPDALRPGTPQVARLTKQWWQAHFRRHAFG